MPRTPFRALIAVAALALAALALAACGGDDGGDEDPRAVLEATFSNEQEVDSGVIDFSFDLKAEGEQSAETKATLGGPFQSEDGQFPRFDVEAELSVESDQGNLSGTGGLISTGDRAFVSFQGTDYELPQQAVRQFTRTFSFLQEQNEQQSQDQADSAQQLIDSFTELSNEGEADVEGTETTHVSGTLDVAKFSESVRAQVRQQAGAGALPKSQLGQVDATLDQLDSLVENASFDVYSGTDDDLLRKLEVDLELSAPGGDSITADMSLTLSDVNEPQEISGPSQAQPLNDLLQQFNVDPGSLGELGAALGTSSGSAPQAGGSPEAPSGGASQAYLECLQTAKTSDALQECASLLE